MVLSLKSLHYYSQMKCKLVLSTEDNLLTFSMEDNSPNIRKLNMYAPFKAAMSFQGIESIKVYRVQMYFLHHPLHHPSKWLKVI